MSWFRCLGGAMVKYGVKGLLGVVPFGDVLVDVAADVWEKYRKDRRQSNLAGDLEAVAAADPVEVQKAITQAVQEVAADQPVDIQLKLCEYLTQAPYAIRRSFRRPSDASGKSVPASLSLQQALDLVPFLPTAMPRFKSGDRPLPGVPLVLRELLGKGGFGEVWLASHPRDDSLKVALKFCLDERTAESLRHESRVLKQVRSQGKHAGIVSLRQIWDESEPLCLEYEYVEGADLCGLIRELHADGPPSPDVVARWMLNLLEPVRFVHALTPPIVHRDLKPANILVERQKDGNLQLRIADFGISDVVAREALRDTASQSILPVGVGGFTALYASPQQMHNDPADPRDDVHALGVIWLQMLTGDLNKGRPSGSGWKVPLRSRGMTEPMLELLEQCMDDVAEVRPIDATDLATRLKTNLDKSIVTALACEIVNSLGMKLILVPAGTFLMGSPEGEGEDNEHPLHEAEITLPFYMAAFQVTQEQYQRVMGNNPSFFSATGGGRDKVRGIDTKRFPVDNVTWDEAVAFCDRLSNLPEERKAGRTYRLPTEAQWEYACREGATSPQAFHFGNSLSSTQANFDGNYPLGGAAKGPYLERPCPVGSYVANALGLFDMYGNVWEWCLDWYDANYYKNSQKKDPQGPEKGECRVLRGGSWYSSGNSCRAAYRGKYPPGDRDTNDGFRVCCFLDW